MRTGVSVPTFGDLADVRLLAELAALAETSGWDGFFVWDHVNWPYTDALIDPTVALTAIALATRRIRFGPTVTPLSRRRPAKVARETMTLDRLSDGRLILGAGAGDMQQEFEDLGDTGTARDRAGRLDEALAVLAGLWSAKKFSFDGDHHQVRNVRFRPGPVQQPRIPVWIGGNWPHQGPLRRAARWDGYLPLRADGHPVTPQDVRDIAGKLDLPERPGFDLIVAGREDDQVPEFAAAGATWWLFAPTPWTVLADDIRARIAAGPPATGH